MQELVESIIDNYSIINSESLRAYSKFYDFKRNSIDLVECFERKNINI